MRRWGGQGWCQFWFSFRWSAVVKGCKVVAVAGELVGVNFFQDQWVGMIADAELREDHGS